MVLKTSLDVTKPHTLYSPWNKVRELNAEYGVFFASVQGGEQAEWGTNTWAKLVNIVYKTTIILKNTFVFGHCGLNINK